MTRAARTAFWVCMAHAPGGCAGRDPEEPADPITEGPGCVWLSQNNGDLHTELEVFRVNREALFTFRQKVREDPEDVVSGAARVWMDDLDRLDVPLPLEGRLGPCDYTYTQGSGYEMSCVVNGITARMPMSTTDCFDDAARCVMLSDR